MYLMIENPGVAPIEGFYMMGVSTSRGVAGKLNQFGSGGKNYLTVMLRCGLKPVICLGSDRVEFFTEPNKMGEKEYNRLCYTFKGETHKTSIATEYGEIDWGKNVEMACREIVTNAIDGCDNIKDVKIELVQDIEPKEGFTRVYTPLTPEVEKFYQTIPDRFLQLGAGFQAEKVLLYKKEAGKCRVYRMGVFVRELESPSLFDYNFGQELKIDEARTLDSWKAQSAIAEYYSEAPVKELENIFGCLPKIHNFVEGGVSEYSLRPSTDAEIKRWKEAFINTYGERAVIAPANSGTFTDAAVKRGYKVIVVQSAAWYESLKRAGIQQAILVTGANEKGHFVKHAGSTLIGRVFKVWQKLEDAGLTNNRPMPNIKVYNSIMEGGCEMMGYYDDNTHTIHIHQDHQQNNQVILEELAHAITQASDYTRDIQDFAFKMAATFMFEKRRKRQSREV